MNNKKEKKELYIWVFDGKTIKLDVTNVTDCKELGVYLISDSHGGIPYDKIDIVSPYDEYLKTIGAIYVSFTNDTKVAIEKLMKTYTIDLYPQEHKNLYKALKELDKKEGEDNG